MFVKCRYPYDFKRSKFKGKASFKYDQYTGVGAWYSFRTGVADDASCSYLMSCFMM